MSTHVRPLGREEILLQTIAAPCCEARLVDERAPVRVRDGGEDAQHAQRAEQHLAVHLLVAPGEPPPAAARNRRACGVLLSQHVAAARYELKHLCLQIGCEGGGGGRGEEGEEAVREER